MQPNAVFPIRSFGLLTSSNSGSKFDVNQINSLHCSPATTCFFTRCFSPNNVKSRNRRDFLTAPLLSCEKGRGWPRIRQKLVAVKRCFFYPRPSASSAVLTVLVVASGHFANLCGPLQLCVENENIQRTQHSPHLLVSPSAWINST